MQRTQLSIATFFVILMLASCAALIGTHEVNLPMAKLQAGLEHRFPINRRILEVFDIQFSQPQLAISSESERVSLTMETTLSSPLMPHSRKGRLVFSGHPFLDTVQHAIFLHDARVDQFVIDGIDETHQRQLAMAASVVTDQVMKDVPLYRFHSDDLHYAGVQFVPTRSTITPTALAVAFAPAS